MRISKIYNIVEGAGEINAYWATRNGNLHYGERGWLSLEDDGPNSNLMKKKEKNLVFISELPPNETVRINSSREVHVPSIGHFSQN